MGVAIFEDLAATLVMRQTLTLEPMKERLFPGGEVHAFASQGYLASPPTLLGAGKFTVCEAGLCRHE
jgi:hypothetical protein